MKKMDVNDLKEQFIAWCIDVINNPDEYTGCSSRQPGVSPIVYLTSSHNDSKGAKHPAERCFGLQTGVHKKSNEFYLKDCLRWNQVRFV